MLKVVSSAVSGTLHENSVFFQLLVGNLLNLLHIEAQTAHEPLHFLRAHLLAGDQPVVDEELPAFHILLELTGGDFIFQRPPRRPGQAVVFVKGIAEMGQVILGRGKFIFRQLRLPHPQSADQVLSHRVVLHLQHFLNPSGHRAARVLLVLRQKLFKMSAVHAALLSGVLVDLLPVAGQHLEVEAIVVALQRGVIPGLGDGKDMLLLVALGVVNLAIALGQFQLLHKVIVPEIHPFPFHIGAHVVIGFEPVAQAQVIQIGQDHFTGAVIVELLVLTLKDFIEPLFPLPLGLFRVQNQAFFQ